ncbi:transporter family-2 protein [Alkalithermobacter thermoalcaliphilus JW-YL-7 = DSM 7308]|uniref:Transporter family-2 protein n=1 Tax=Alkalithermobacter thermoalcaliphilus JW-YL-7 = DSM 7308 TaxID=1121328 RepID=A0A150FS37_CLOPD|nr:protein of unknown function DUF606 [[Clostridium] paradoxum JW-YL-7 = DSM 7308]SHK33500.1 transporter family-2 protein [[Clostridium] paradoxum JW-YL-7 = DSM 7308]
MNNLISCIIGGLISIMVMFNGTLSNAYGGYMSNVIIHSVGLLCIIFILIFTRSKLRIDFKLPLYLYSGGAIGVFTILFNNLTFPVLGVSIPLALGLLGQSVFSIVIDHFGLFGLETIKFEKRKLIGLSFIALGIFVMTFF